MDSVDIGYTIELRYDHAPRGTILAVDYTREEALACAERMVTSCEEGGWWHNGYADEHEYADDLGEDEIAVYTLTRPVECPRPCCAGTVETRAIVVRLND